METWTILSETDTAREVDPEQRIRPRLTGEGSAIAWLPGDGRVDPLRVAGLAIKITDNGFKTLAEVPGETATLFVTNRRVVLVIADISPEGGVAMAFSDLLTGGVAGTVQDATRWATGRARLRKRYHLAAQIDYLSLALIRYYQTTIWGARSILSIAAHTGEPAPRVLEIVETSLSRKEDIAAIAGDILSRAKLAQEREDLRPLTDVQRRAVAEAAFRPSNDAFIASLGESCI